MARHSELISTPAESSSSPAAPAAIDASCRLALVVLFTGAAIWLLLGSVAGLVASIKFHSPTFLADQGWLTYGRVQPVATNVMFYGFVLQAGLGTSLWLLARLGRTVLSQGWLVGVAAAVVNLGVLVGSVGILAGESTGFELMEFPRYASSLVLVGYVLAGLWSLILFHERRERQLFASQWFLVAALFWFPWIYSTACYLLVMAPVRGVTQAVVVWWYGNNLQYVWGWLLGVGTLFYFLPKLTGRDLQSRALALCAFWLLLLCGPWGGIPLRAPVPAWMPVLSNAVSVLTLVPVLAVARSAYGTLGGLGLSGNAEPALRFMLLGVGSLFVAGVAHALSSLPSVSRVTELTWFVTAVNRLNGYGFLVAVLVGAIYYVLPRAVGLDLPAPRLVRMHFWLALGGVLLVAVPLGLGGVWQGIRLNNAEVPFAAIDKGLLPFLRVSTVGELLFVLGHLCLVWNLVGLAVRCSAIGVRTVIETATAQQSVTGGEA